jgi:hypothetical protein
MLLNRYLFAGIGVAFSFSFAGNVSEKIPTSMVIRGIVPEAFENGINQMINDCSNSFKNIMGQPDYSDDWCGDCFYSLVSIPEAYVTIHSETHYNAVHITYQTKPHLQSLEDFNRLISYFETGNWSVSLQKQPLETSDHSTKQRFIASRDGVENMEIAVSLVVDDSEEDGYFVWIRVMKE